MIARRIKKDIKIRINSFRYEKKRFLFKFLFKNLNKHFNKYLNKKIKKIVYFFFLFFKKKPSSVTVQNRCLVSGKSKSIFRKFKLSRIKLKEFLSKGFIPGFSKRNW